MIKIFTLLSFVFFGPMALASIPQLVYCSQPVSANEEIQYTFMFQQMDEEIYPPKYAVHISSTRVLLDDSDPDAPVSSDDDVDSPHQPDESIQLVGSLSPNDPQVIYFHPSGFIRYNEQVEPSGEAIMTFQLPNEPYDIAREVGRCFAPEPRIGVGN